MATKIYGTLTGSSAAKYYIWLSITQNSQDISANKSNLTVKLLLKRNDGYPDSAYNLYENSNSVKLTVGGSNVVNRYITVDTRNCVTVTLASWTGDVSHKSDGTLDLSITGVFAMDSTSLSGGSVSGVFSCTSIPRASTISFSASSINLGESLKGEISSASTGFSHKISFSLGSKKSTLSLSAGEKICQFTVPSGWASEIISAKSAYMNIALITYNDTKKTGTKNYSVKVKVPGTSEFLPDFNMVLERVDGAVPADWGEYVKGLSKVKVDVSGVSVKYGASVKSYTVTADTLKSSQVPCMFALSKSGAVDIKVTLTDSRGYSVSKIKTINVRDYSLPSVVIKDVKRCDKDGLPLDNGNYLLVDYRVSYSDVNSKNFAVAKAKYRASNIAYFNEDVIITDSPCVIGNGDLDQALSYVLSLSVYDGINENSVERSVPSSHIPFNIRSGGNGAAFGCYSEKDNELKVAWDLNLQGLLNCEYLEITDCDNFKDHSSQNVALYFPALKMCFIRFRAVIAKDLSPQINYLVATIPKSPTLLTPLSVFYYNENNTRAQAGIKYSTGEIIVRFDSAVPAGDTIYISGFCLLDKK